MTDTVFCRKYQEELPTMDRPPYPGSKGEEIFSTVSKKAWLEWLQLQTMLINEKQLDLSEKSARDYLNQQLENFLDNKETDKAEGFIPLD
tara:strand:+ start:516 stop:785 length:270 start_codon:yes stop_codon:yes gene_type:complete